MIDIKTLISDINLKMDEEFIIQLDGIITTKIKIYILVCAKILLNL